MKVSDAKLKLKATDLNNFNLDLLNHTDEFDRGLYIYNFGNAKEELILKLTEADGMVSHVKFLKKRDKVGTKIFYVKDAQEIIMYDMATKKKTSIG